MRIIPKIRMLLLLITVCISNSLLSQSIKNNDTMEEGVRRAKVEKIKQLDRDVIIKNAKSIFKKEHSDIEIDFYNYNVKIINVH